jgi:DNA-binding transcriptional MocR family regulator
MISGTRTSEIAASIESAIREGELQPGQRLPTVRGLAATLQVSPTTIAAVYRGLQRRGYLTTGGRRGTTISRRPALATRAPVRFAASVRDLATGNPDPALLPRWDQQHLFAVSQPRLYGQDANLPELLELASARFKADGIPARDLAVVGGALDGVERVLEAHLLPGDRVAVEDPCYPGVADLVGALGLVAEPVRVDEYGFEPADFERVLRGGVDACVITPRVQNPTGAALDARRAQELGQILAARPNVLVVEDDHAGPISGVPSCTLRSSDPNRARWAVVRSVSKSLGPDIRLGLLAADRTTAARVSGRQAAGPGWVSYILQRLVVSLWSDSGTNGLLERAASTYSARRQALIEDLAGHGIAAWGRSGFNVWIEVPEEEPVVRALAGAGWGVAAGERYRIKSPPAIRITAATLEPEDARRLAADLAAILAPASATRLG